MEDPVAGLGRVEGPRRRPDPEAAARQEEWRARPVAVAAAAGAVEG